MISLQRFKLANFLKDNDANFADVTGAGHVVVGDKNDISQMRFPLNSPTGNLITLRSCPHR